MLKWLALLFMVIDHIGYYFAAYMPSEVYLVLRTIGRLAFPIFAYGIVLGARRTRNVTRYFLRLAGFAIIGQIMMELAAYFSRQQTFNNVLFTLTAGLMLIIGIELATKSMQDVVMSLRPITAMPNGNNQPNKLFQTRVNLKGITLPSWLGLLLGTICILLALFIVILLEPDYGLFGIAMMLLFYILESQLEPYSPTLNQALKLKRQNSFFLSLLALNLVNMTLSMIADPMNRSWAVVSVFSTFSIYFFPLQAKETSRPPAWQKYFFYLFYPAHLSLFMLLSAYLRHK